MPIESNLNQSPWHDDYDERKDFYRVLFKPGVSVQVREMNQLQAILQKQIERFGDNIIKKGTVVDGCNFRFFNNYHYAKILDNEVNSDVTAVPELYIGMYAENETNGLKAYVVNGVEGFEAENPDLKTIYLSYINSGDDNQTNTFSAADVLVIKNQDVGIFEVDIDNGSLGFSNTDSVVFVSAIAVNVSTGSWSVGDHVYQSSSGANVQVTAVDTTTLADANLVILSVKPRTSDLTNAAITSVAWTLEEGESVANPANTAAGTIVEIFGESAGAVLETNGIGKITNIEMTDRGTGYTQLPYVTVKSTTGTLASLQLTAKNYFARIKVASVANAVGTGYAFGVSEGITYQKGHFLRVSPQVVVVQKYHNQPNNVTVGFTTEEEIIDSNIDTTLLDNALGTENENAPGADRLKLIPTLTVMDLDDARANNEFFNLVEWNDGNPYKQNRVTQYSRLGEEMAQRTFDESGNYVIDTFQVATESPANSELEGTYFTVAVDPGQAYISGHKVQTLRNYKINIKKGLDTRTTNNIISLNYGNYIRIKEIGGLFQFSTGDTCNLYDTAKGFLSNNALWTAGNITPVGTKIGTAKMRSLILENGEAGGANTVYRLFLFDIKMNPGQNFESVKSVHYDGTNDGIADVVLETNPQSLANVAVLEGGKNDKLVFSAGCESLKNSNDTIYTYRTIFQTTSTANTGLLSKSIAASPDEFFPYTGALSDAQMKELYVVPIGNTLYQYTNLTGTVSVNTTTASVVGSGTSFFNDFAPGDYVLLYSNNLSQDIKKVISITNSTFMTVDSNTSYANTAAVFKRVFPKQVPIPFGSRDGLSANVDANGNILTLTFAHANGLALTFEGSVTVNTALGVNIERRGVTASSKTANRKRFVKIAIANNAGGNSGPWCLGIPDVFRMRHVYTHTASTVNASSTDVSKFFYIDHNQTSNFLDWSWLYLKPRSGLSFTDNDWLLVEFDHFTNDSTGYYDTTSYLRTSNTAQIAALDSANLSSLTTAASSWEVPEVYTYKGDYYDMLNHLDFRPSKTNTVISTTTLASAPTNPPEYVGSIAAANIAGSVQANSTGTTITGSGTTFTGSFANGDYIAVYANGTYYEVKQITQVVNNTQLILKSKHSFANAGLANAAVYTIGNAFGNTADPANDKKFPYPDASCRTRIEQYLGRVDSVFIGGEDGNIYVLKGIPDVDPRRRYEPNHPKDSLKLQSLSVPPYPNLGQLITGKVQQVLVTNIANERTMNLRIKTRAIVPLMSTLDQQLSQPMVYTMEDIGNLERRIKDLEYYVSLSVLETSITNKIIPSSVDRSLNRFKFGFFADDFSTETYSDLENPQYAASIEVEGDVDFGAFKNPLEDNKWADQDKVNPTSSLLAPSKLVQRKTNRVVPPKYIWSVAHFADNFDYINEVLIDQPLISITPPQSVAATVTVSNTSTTNTIVGQPISYVGTMVGRQVSGWSCSKGFKVNNLIYTVVDLVCTGLRPNTLHNFYVNGVISNEDILPVGGDFGDAPVSDAYGKMTFRLYLVCREGGAIDPDRDANKALVMAAMNNIKPTTGSSGYTTFEVKAQNSSAQMLVASRTPQKLLAHVPIGNP